MFFLHFSLFSACSGSGRIRNQVASRIQIVHLNLHIQIWCPDAAWIRIVLGSQIWIYICSEKPDPHLDPHQKEKQEAVEAHMQCMQFTL